MENIGWLRKLKASNRNCNFRRSVMVVVFIETKSRLTYLGPRKEPRRDEPNTSSSVGCANAERFQKPRIDFGPLFGFPRRSQKSCSKLTLFIAASLVVRHEAANPLRTVLIPPTCQPPAPFRADRTSRSPSADLFRSEVHRV